jgi:hypothetical protein
MPFSDLEVTGADLEQAFVALTCDLANVQTVDDAISNRLRDTRSETAA